MGALHTASATPSWKRRCTSPQWYFHVAKRILRLSRRQPPFTEFFRPIGLIGPQELCEIASPQDDRHIAQPRFAGDTQVTETRLTATRVEVRLPAGKT